MNHSIIKQVLNKLFIQRDLNFMEPKRELNWVLPHLGKTSLDLRTVLRRSTRGNLPHF